MTQRTTATELLSNWQNYDRKLVDSLIYYRYLRVQYENKASGLEKKSRGHRTYNGAENAGQRTQDIERGREHRTENTGKIIQEREHRTENIGQRTQD